MLAFDTRGESEHGFPWLEEFSSINPPFFDEADERIMHLISQGLVPCILGCWGYYLPILGIKRMKLHWRYIMARWGALPVIWATSGEQTMPWYLAKNMDSDSQLLKREWTKVTRYINGINSFDRIVTAHPQESVRKSVDEPSLLNFEMQQTNHEKSAKQHAAVALSGWKAKPTMPVISGEARYEHLELLVDKVVTKVTTADTRQAFWSHLLNSGCAGHTYGANGLWQVNLPDKPIGDTPNGYSWGNITWQEAMHLPGSSQLSEAKEMLGNLPWHLLEPMMINKKWQHEVTNLFKQAPVAAASTKDSSLAIYYLIGLKPFILNMSQFEQPMLVEWFDPSSGEVIVTSEESINNAGNKAFTPVSENADGDEDWVLVLKQKQLI